MRILLFTMLLTSCAATNHPSQKSALGTARSSDDLLAVLDVPGDVVVETINSTDWQVDRGGLINLEHPKAKAAGLTDGPEPIQIYFHVIRHPTKGTFIVDTGVETALRDDPSKSALSWLLLKYLKPETLKVHMPLGEWISKEPQPLSGVFLTHVHFDHITGMADVPKGTAVYSGPGEAEASAAMNMATQGTANRAMAGKAAISEWQYAPDTAGRFEGVIDVFGDGLVWAIWMPGHTPGSTAYLVRTASGPVLLTGDVTHTRWGWDNDVEPGTFTSDGPKSVESFRKLKAFALEHPNMSVRLGHQQ